MKWGFISSVEDPEDIEVSEEDDEEDDNINKSSNGDCKTVVSCQGPTMKFTVEEFSFINLIRKKRNIIIGRINNFYDDDNYR